MSDETKKCPFCAETVKSEAIVCKHCGRDLQSKVSTESKKEKKKGFLRIPIKVWKITLPLWLVLVVGCLCISSVYSMIDSGLRSTGVLPTNTTSPTKTNTPIPSNTSAPTATKTLLPTKTKTPTLTPTETLMPINASETAVALDLKATSDYKQRKSDILLECQPISWVELSEVEYAREHEGECVYIKGRISTLNLADDLFDMYIGNYSARIAVGLDNLDKTSDRLQEDMWINVYGTVSTTTWITTNNFTGKESPAVGLQARLLELPGNIFWLEY